MDSEYDYHIYTTGLSTTESSRVLKHTDLFGVFDEAGEVRPLTGSSHGLYLHDMRHLSQLETRIFGQRPLLLSSTVKQGNALLTADLTNPEVNRRGDEIPSDVIHVLRSRFVTAHTLHDRLRLHNYWKHPVRVAISFQYNADFADIFEIRGTNRTRRGEIKEVEVDENTVRHTYEGLDGRLRRTRLVFRTPPEVLEEHLARYELEIEPYDTETIGLDIHCSVDEELDSPISVSVPEYNEDLERVMSEKQLAHLRRCEISTSNEFFNRWLGTSEADLQLLTSETEWGVYPYAGTPWFNTVFGRDGLLTALQNLTVDPSLARGVLAYLANHQAEEVMPERDAEPGKILHETRQSEMAATGEVPFEHYYGSVDSTPLFIYLAGRYHKRTADDAFIDSIWPAIENALEWLDEWGDVDGDGFVEYGRRTEEGLTQQGWKDSHDSVFYDSGEIAESPIALCEVQAYVYGARRQAAAMAESRGDDEMARRQREEADRLREKFEEVFWSDDLGLYMLALDGDNEPCRVRASNAGHCLLTGIAGRGRAREVADAMLSDDFFTGWGIRTLAEGEVRFNPLSYHNGSIWPHDTALIAAGMAKYGYRRHVLQLLEGMFSAARHFDLNRLPELFCGFGRRPDEGPTRYPVACSPQAWASGTVFMMLEAALGLEIDARRGMLAFRQPKLPESLDSVRIRNLAVGDEEVDLELRRYENDVGIEITRRTGDVEVQVVK